MNLNTDSLIYAAYRIAADECEQMALYTGLCCADKLRELTPADAEQKLKALMLEVAVRVDIASDGINLMEKDQLLEIVDEVLGNE